MSMSGHSKWATIKRQKSVADLKRGLTFTKLSNAITIAVRQGGGIVDIDKNFRLRLAVEKAQATNMPKENIQKAIRRAMGKGEGALEEVIYEGFAPEGVSVIVEAATDSIHRTTSEIKSIFSREGAKFGQAGSCSYQFTRLGKITVKKNGKTFNQIFEIVAKSYALDIEEKADCVFVYVDPLNLAQLRDKLLTLGLTITNIETLRKPISRISINDQEKLEKVTSFLRKLEELDDVQKVYSNLETR